MCIEMRDIPRRSALFSSPTPKRLIEPDDVPETRSGLRVESADPANRALDLTSSVFGLKGLRRLRASTIDKRSSHIGCTQLVELSEAKPFAESFARDTFVRCDRVAGFEANEDIDRDVWRSVFASARFDRPLGDIDRAVRQAFNCRRLGKLNISAFHRFLVRVRFLPVRVITRPSTASLADRGPDCTFSPCRFNSLACERLIGLPSARSSLLMISSLIYHLARNVRSTLQKSRNRSICSQSGCEVK